VPSRDSVFVVGEILAESFGLLKFHDEGRYVVDDKDERMCIWIVL